MELCRCGHPKTGHIYHSGACRTGTAVCPCNAYDPVITVDPGAHTLRVAIPKGYAWYVRQFIDKAMEGVAEMQRASTASTAPIGAREEDAEYVLLVTPHSPVPDTRR